MYQQTSNLALPVNKPGDYTDKDVPGLAAVPCFGYRTAVATFPSVFGANLYSSFFVSVAEVFLDGQDETVSHALPLGVVPGSRTSGSQRTRRFVFALSGVGSFVRVRAWRFNDATAVTLAGATLSMAREATVIEPDSDGGDIGLTNANYGVLSLSNLVGAKKIGVVVQNNDTTDAVTPYFYYFVNAGRNTGHDLSVMVSTYTPGTIAASTVGAGVSGDIVFDAGLLVLSYGNNAIDSVEASGRVIPGA